MKLSEAILKGCETTKPNCDGGMFRVYDGVMYCCAIGAALVGVGLDIGRIHNRSKTISEHFPCLINTDGGYTDTGWDIIRKNDDCDNPWTREQIAADLAVRGM